MLLETIFAVGLFWALSVAYELSLVQVPYAFKKPMRFRANTVLFNYLARFVSSAFRDERWEEELKLD